MEEIRIKCEAETIFINKKTGYIYKDEAEAKADTTVDPQDIQRDVYITVPPIDLNSLTK
jgi:hypothetical protein